MQQVHLIPQKIVALPALLALVAQWRAAGQTISFTNGVFDLLHEGHVFSLSQAASEANRLIVAINSDASVKRLKGPQRPIHHQQARALLMASMMMVDAVIIFEEDTPQTLIAALLPDVLVKGGDYTPEQIAGATEVLANGGRVVINALVPNISTTAIIQQMKNQS
jgi:D-beta-D-heptose 7-phosphate kinase/D-beta-D-heptose 1-phosphate adenosyltransferase